MNEFAKMLDRIEISRIATYFLYGSEPNSVITDSYQARISEAYKDIYARLADLFPTADKTDGALQDTISDFALTHSDVYLQAGVLIGFQLYKVLEEGYHSPKAEGIDIAIKNYMASLAASQEKQKENDSILDNLFYERRYHSLENALIKNEDYQNTLNECNEEISKLEQCGLSEEQQLAVDKALSASNAVGSEYGAAAYRQGFHDARKLIRELFCYS